MIYKYLRFSTCKQDEMQQENMIDSYLKAKGMQADSTITDAGISGGISFKKRNLGDLCKSLKKNDVILVSEVSRLTRSGISELAVIIDKYFKPNKLRLIICNVNLDIDCSDINPMVELQLAMMATFAKIEKQLIQERTKNALDARKKQIDTVGYYLNKKGEKRTKLGGGAMSEESRVKACETKMKKAASDEKNIFFARYIHAYEERCGKLTANSQRFHFEQIAKELNALGMKTHTGLMYDAGRVRALWVKMKNREYLTA